MNSNLLSMVRALSCVVGLAAACASGADAPESAARSFILRNFHFQSGETLPEVRCVCGPLSSALFDGIDLVAVSPEIGRAHV